MHTCAAAYQRVFYYYNYYNYYYQIESYQQFCSLSSGRNPLDMGA